MSNESDYSGDKNLRTRTQCSAFCIAIILSVSLGTSLSFSHIGERADVCLVEIQRRVNPNVAPVASLVRLPGIGPSKAEAIVNFRLEVEEDETLFKAASDLEKISGIGPGTVRKIEPYLYFDRTGLN